MNKRLRPCQYRRLRKQSGLSREWSGITTEDHRKAWTALCGLRLTCEMQKDGPLDLRAWAFGMLTFRQAILLAAATFNSACFHHLALSFLKKYQASEKYSHNSRPTEHLRPHRTRQPRRTPLPRFPLPTPSPPPSRQRRLALLFSNHKDHCQVPTKPKSPSRQRRDQKQPRYPLPPSQPKA